MNESQRVQARERKLVERVGSAGLFRLDLTGDKRSRPEPVASRSQPRLEGQGGARLRVCPEACGQECACSRRCVAGGPPKGRPLSGQRAASAALLPGGACSLGQAAEPRVHGLAVCALRQVAKCAACVGSATIPRARACGSG